MDFRLFHVDERVKKIVVKSFYKSEEMIENDVKTIKEWMKTQPHLPEIMEDTKIRNFLILNKCNLEKTKEKIDMYYTMRSLVPDFFEYSNPSLQNFKNLMDLTYFCIHPKAIGGIYRVFIMKLKEPNKALLKEMIVQFCNITEIRLSEDLMVGEIMVFDMANLSVEDVKLITSELLAKAFAIFEKVYSLRVREIYLLNSPSHINVLLGILKSLLKPKIFERIKIYQNDDMMKKLFIKDDLPKDYGGRGASLQELNELMQQKLDQYQYRFDELNLLRVDESLRPCTDISIG